jgi:hypothetical protein
MLRIRCSPGASCPWEVPPSGAFGRPGRRVSKSLREDPGSARKGRGAAGELPRRSDCDTVIQNFGNA